MCLSCVVREDNVLVFETLLVLVPRWLVVVSLSNCRQQSALVKHLEGRHAAVFFFYSESPLIITHTHLYTHLCSHTLSHLDHQAPTETHTHNPLLVDFHWLEWINLRVLLSLNVFLPLAIFPWTHFHSPFWSIALEKVNEQQQHSETKASVLPFLEKKELMCLIGDGNTFRISSDVTNI